MYSTLRHHEGAGKTLYNYSSNKCLKNYTFLWKKTTKTATYEMWHDSNKAVQYRGKEGKGWNIGTKINTEITKSILIKKKNIWIFFTWDTAAQCIVFGCRHGGTWTRFFHRQRQCPKFLAFTWTMRGNFNDQFISISSRRYHACHKIALRNTKDKQNWPFVMARNSLAT